MPKGVSHKGSCQLKTRFVQMWLAEYYGNYFAIVYLFDFICTMAVVSKVGAERPRLVADSRGEKSLCQRDQRVGNDQRPTLEIGL